MVLEDLGACTDLRSMREFLEKTPTSLYGYYEHMLSELNTNDGKNGENSKIATKILSWIAYALSPLTLGELNVAIALEKAPTNFRDIRDLVPLYFKQRLKDDCGVLVEVRKYKDVETVHLLHHSVKDFLVNYKPVNRTTKDEISFCTPEVFRQSFAS